MKNVTNNIHDNIIDTEVICGKIVIIVRFPEYFFLKSISKNNFK